VKERGAKPVMQLDERVLLVVAGDDDGKPESLHGLHRGVRELRGDGCSLRRSIEFRAQRLELAQQRAKLFAGGL